MNNKKDLQDNDLLQEIDREKLFSEIQDNKMKDSDKGSFVAAIMENYFLDNDNINFLEDYGYGFWNFLEGENCICLSEKKFGDCCKPKLKKNDKIEYLSLVESLDSEENYKIYLKNLEPILSKVIEKNNKNSKCQFPDCKNLAVENNLFSDIDLDKNEFLSTAKKNIIDSKFTMGENFFNPLVSDIFNFYGLCAEHDTATSQNNLKIGINSTELEKALFNLRTVIYKKIKIEVTYYTLYEEFINNYLNVTKTGYQAMMVFKMRKIINSVKEIRDIFSNLFEAIKNNNLSAISFVDYDLKKQDNFQIRDLINFQVTPKSYTVINSVNNPLINEEMAVINVIQSKKSTFVSFMYLKKSEKIKKYFEEWSEINEEKAQNLEPWVTNNSLILSKTF
ncbi:hypothetical protein [Spiroplasma alleghenense]|uniref:Uncharacterized protein n=1 Tax=Spiroplasma alleghenense TaxID=216931 RepID=A0A345Z3G8_9MOLU|nr:hypothetical protein [Spiroplasma alleghenense]AXK51147.1 hypothetical protein SALLE_v1c04730 [Spiroplasma alleghenense]